MRPSAILLSLLTIPLLVVPSPAQADDDVLGVMVAMNDGLKAMWMDYRIESIDYLSTGKGQPSDRVLNQPLRWAAGDVRRWAADGQLSYLVDGSGLANSSGIDAADAAEVLAGAVATWDGASCSAPAIVERAWGGGDVTVTDYFLGDGPLGDPFAADVVFGGWLGADSFFFDSDTLAVTVTYVFVDRTSGEPTDVDGDNRLDVALVETYFNDAFEWTTDGGAGSDLTTAALHEVGHALGLGHFGPPPAAVMNPVYEGPRHELASIDQAGLCSVWGADQQSSTGRHF